MDYLNIDDNDVEIWQKLAFAFRNIKDFENAFQAAFNALDLKKDDDWTMYIIRKFTRIKKILKMPINGYAKLLKLIRHTCDMLVKKAHCYISSDIQMKQ